MLIRLYKFIKVGFPIPIGVLFHRFVVGNVKFTKESRVRTTDWFILTGVYTPMNKYFIAFRLIGDEYQLTLASNDFITNDEYPTLPMYNGDKDLGYLTSDKLFTCKEDIEYIFNLRLYRDKVTLTIHENGIKKATKFRQLRSSLVERGTMLATRALGRTATASLELIV